MSAWDVCLKCVAHDVDLQRLNAIRLSCELLLLCTLQADKLLSQDFKTMLDDVISYLPRDRQIMLYSATFPVTVEEFIVRYSLVAAELPFSFMKIHKFYCIVGWYAEI